MKRSFWCALLENSIENSSPQWSPRLCHISTHKLYHTTTALCGTKNSTPPPVHRNLLTTFPHFPQHFSFNSQKQGFAQFWFFNVLHERVKLTDWWTFSHQKWWENEKNQDFIFSKKKRMKDSQILRKLEYFVMNNIYSDENGYFIV